MIEWSSLGDWATPVRCARRWAVRYEVAKLSAMGRPTGGELAGDFEWAADCAAAVLLSLTGDGGVAGDGKGGFWEGRHGEVLWEREQETGASTRRLFMWGVAGGWLAAGAGWVAPSPPCWARQAATETAASSGGEGERERTSTNQQQWNRAATSFEWAERSIRSNRRGGHVRKGHVGAMWGARGMHVENTRQAREGHATTTRHHHLHLLKCSTTFAARRVEYSPISPTYTMSEQVQHKEGQGNHTSIPNDTPQRRQDGMGYIDDAATELDASTVADDDGSSIEEDSDDESRGFPLEEADFIEGSLLPDEEEENEEDLDWGVENEDWELADGGEMRVNQLTPDFTKQYNRVRQSYGAAQGTVAAPLPARNAHQPRKLKAAPVTAGTTGKSLVSPAATLGGVAANPKSVAETRNQKDKADRATHEQVLDSRTRLVLSALVNRGYFALIDGCVSTGKEVGGTSVLLTPGERLPRTCWGEHSSRTIPIPLRRCSQDLPNIDPQLPRSSELHCRRAPFPRRLCVCEEPTQNGPPLG